VVVASSIKEVYHWLGGGPRHGDSAVVYNRRNPNGLGDGGQLFMHLGYNGWQGQPRQVGMRPLAHDHAARAEYWLNDQGGDWWIAEPVFVPPEANVLDFVFSDGEGEYDNAGGKDYHSPVAGDDGSAPLEIDHVAQREAELEAEQGHLDAQFAERAGRAAERKFVSRQGFDKKIKEDPATAKVVVLPEKPVAGQEIEIYYRHQAKDPDADPKAPLRGAADIFVQGGWNRWTHPKPFGPMRMEPAPRPPGGETAQFALVAKVQIPHDAHVCDFVFTDDARVMEGRYDSRDGLDYHKKILGARGGAVPSLKIVHVAVEMAPIAKVGGMGDVVTALSRAVIEDGHSVEVILPKYDCMDTEQIDNLSQVDAFVTKDNKTCFVWKGEVEEVPVTFLQPDNGNFDVGCIYGRGDDHVRFEYFSDCALRYLEHAAIVPDIVHAHDWSTSHVCFARRTRLPPGAATVLTIHNLQFGADLIDRAMKKVTFATTVSPTYAEEISNHNAISHSKGKMVGIRNGIDVELWDPLTDEFMPVNFDAVSFPEGKAAARRELCERLGMELNENKPLVGVVARLTHQKGIHLIKHACWRSLDRGGQFVLLGSSPDGNVQNDFNKMAYEVGGRFPGQSGFVFAYDEPLSHLIYAASDMLLVPSMFEPCGLTQMIAMRYGTVPVVRRTGGLKDTVFDVHQDESRAAESGLRVNGFSFEGSNDRDIESALDRALGLWYADKEKWRSLVRDIMRQDWGWNDPAKTYVEHYWKAAKTMKDAYFSKKNLEEEDDRR
jgi:starch synthase